MKRVGYLFEEIIKIENLELAIKNASKRKHKRRSVANILDDIPGHARILQEMLINKKYKTSPYSIETIVDNSSNKSRDIMKPKFFPDQCVQWAIMQVVEPVFSKSLYKYTCGCVPKRGTHYAMKHVQKWIRTDFKNTKYVLQMDVTKYYPSVDHDTLISLLSKRIKDPHVMELFEEIVKSGGDGLPIGNYTSQWLANFYLMEFDHFVKQELQAKYYIRYMDDIVIFGSNKRKLHKDFKKIKAYLNALHLTIKPNHQIYPLSKRHLDFLGFRFYRTHTTLRRRNCLRIRRRAKKISKKKKITYKDASAMISYMGWIKYSDSYQYYQKHVRPYIKINQLKEIVRNESIQRQSATTDYY